MHVFSLKTSFAAANLALCFLCVSSVSSVVKLLILSLFV